MIREAASSSEGYLVMVMDDAATRVISPVLRMYDIMEEKVTLVEKLSLNRQPFPEMEVIYLVAPTDASVEYILRDFEDPKKPKYGDVHLFFLSHASDAIFNKLRQNSVLLSRVKALKEVNLDFLALESGVFSLDLKNSLCDLFAPDIPSSHLQQHTTEIARKLVTLCATLNEYPYIRFPADNIKMQNLAQVFRAMMDRFLADNRDFRYVGQEPGEGYKRGTLLLLDRTVDPLAPLLHEFTYQAMVNDVLEVHEESYEYEIETNSGKQKKQVLLNENDALWTHFRHIHISDTIDTITAKFKEHMKTQGAQLAKGEIQDISSMADGVRQLAQYQEQAGKLAQHMQMADACMDYFQKRKLHQLAMLEQTMATGVTNEGKKPKLAQLTNDLDQMLRSDEVGLSEKVRLLAMFIITQEGIQERDRKMLMKVVHQKHPNIVENGKEEAALLNLQHLGVTLQRSGGRKSQSKAALKKAKARAMEEGGYSLSRFVPVIKEMTQNLVQGELSESAFPYVVPPPEGSSKRGSKPAESKSVVVSLRKKGPSNWSQKKAAGKDGAGSDIVFIAGGACFSEMRSVYEVSKELNSNVILGATSLLNPEQFLDQVSTLDGQHSLGAIALEKLQIDIEE
eukprot:g2343.t1